MARQILQKEVVRLSPKAMERALEVSRRRAWEAEIALKVVRRLLRQGDGNAKQISEAVDVHFTIWKGG